jgi:protein ImuB
MARFLCLWFPNWSIQRLMRSRPELDGRPVALVVNGPRGGVVKACSDTAAAQGVHISMPAAEAQALERDLTIVPRDSVADRRALEKLAQACERFTPCVALEEGDEPDSLLLDVSNLEHLWGSEAELAARVRAFFTRRGYQVRVALADTLGMAWGLGHFSKNGSKNGNLPFAIPSLPVEALRIAGDTAALLRELGIATVGQLLSLPREGLALRFGEELLRRVSQFTGAVAEVIEPHRPLAALEAEHSLEEPVADRAALLHVLRQLVERLARRLIARDEGAVLLLCSLRCTDRRPIPLRIGLLEPSANARQLLELIELHLETLRLTSEIVRVELRVAVAGRLGQRQGELFAERWSSDPHQLSLLVNRLSSRLGYERVLRAEVRASPVPERAVRWAPVTLRSRARKTRRSPHSALRTPHSPLRTPHSTLPLLLHAQPQPIEVVCVAPNGPPQFVWLDGRRERIVACVGAERIETLWWRGPAVRRDYYRVATESSGQLWLFRRRQDARWFLHGVFG